MTHGGGALNAAAAIVRLGGQVTLAGAIGADDLGAILCGRIEALGVGRDLLQVVAGQATPHSAVLITPDGERTIINRRDDGLDLLPVVPEPFAFAAVLADYAISGFKRRSIGHSPCRWPARSSGC